YETIIDVPAHLFNVGQYTFEVALHRPYVEYLDRKENLNFEITSVGDVRSLIFTKEGKNLGKMGAILTYETKQYA
ncbi:MAG TPA: hypothetical protein VIY48_15505, partial [Candidatus Paceibacterota bacterium]